MDGRRRPQVLRAHRLPPNREAVGHKAQVTFRPPGSGPSGPDSSVLGAVKTIAAALGVGG